MMGKHDLKYDFIWKCKWFSVLPLTTERAKDTAMSSMHRNLGSSTHQYFYKYYSLHCREPSHLTQNYLALLKIKVHTRSDPREDPLKFLTYAKFKSLGHRLTTKSVISQNHAFSIKVPVLTDCREEDTIALLLWEAQTPERWKLIVISYIPS